MKDMAGLMCPSSKRSSPKYALLRSTNYNHL
jgi:hypothetical protein